MSEVRKRVASMIWMAIDPRTPEPEAVAAISAIRRMNVSIDELKLARGNAASRVEVVERVPEFTDPEMVFGKWKGRRLSQIAMAAPGYLHWLLTSGVAKGYLVEQVELCLAGAKPKIQTYGAASTTAPTTTK